MSETPITVEKAFDWAEKFKAVILPLFIAGVMATGLYYTIDNNLSRVIESAKVNEIRIEELRKNHQDSVDALRKAKEDSVEELRQTDIIHDRSITEMKANERAMNSRLDVMAATINQRFDTLDRRMETLANAMQALAMALNQRSGKDP